MGVEFWEEDDEYEQVNWYMKLTKCNNDTSEVTCKSTEEINEYIKGIVLTKKIDYPTVDIEYLDLHKHDPLPFEIDKPTKKRHILRNDELVFLSATIQKVEINVDHELVVSDFINEEHTTH